MMNALQEKPSPAPYSARNLLKPINFYCHEPRAQTVQLLCDFNRWQPFTLERRIDGWWYGQVMLPHGHHKYQFLVDGQRVLDPHATGKAHDEQNGPVSLVAVS